MKKDIQQPVFKELKEDNNYLIYEDGRVFSKRQNKFLKGRKDKNKNLFYVLPLKEPCAQGNRKQRVFYKEYLLQEYFLRNYVRPQVEWVIIPFNPLYSVSKDGFIRNNSSLSLLFLDKRQKYIRVQMYPNKYQYYYLHRIVYCVFNNDYDLEGYEIAHRDGNIYNNKLDNLYKVKTGSTTISLESRVK